MNNNQILQVYNEKYIIYTLLIPQEKIELVKNKIKELHNYYYNEIYDSEENYYQGVYEYIDEWLNEQDYIKGYEMEALFL